MANDFVDAETEVFPVEYEERGGAYNAELRGKGTLRVERGAGRCVFEGRQRRMLGRPEARTILFEQISNVVVAGRRVEFDVAGTGSRAKPRAFLFFCENEDAAAAVGRALPQVKDSDFVAANDFVGRLRELPGASSAMGSPTNLLVAVNVTVFVAMGLLGAGWFETGDMDVYIRFGANNGGVTTNGEWWRLAASMFIHFGAMHLMFNMWALFQTGHLVERLLGRAHFVVAYFGSGLAGSLATIMWNGDRVWSAGASGAVFGVFGMLLGFMGRERHTVPRSVMRPLLKSTLWFAGFNLLFGWAHPGIDNAAHLGGFFSGIVLGGVMARPVDRQRRARLGARRLFAGMAAAGALVALGVGASPRFNYNWDEERAWEAALREPLAKETEILERQREALAAFQSPEGTNAAFSEWVTREAIPFYEKWIGELRAMELTPGKDTDRRRELLVGLMRSKIENYRQLIADVNAGDPDAAGRYYEAEARMMERMKGESTGETQARGRAD